MFLSFRKLKKNYSILWIGMALSVLACSQDPSSNNLNQIFEAHLAVVGGEPVSSQEPSVSSIVGVHVYSDESSPILLRVCGGTLVDDYTVITAAHCFPTKPKVLKVKLLHGDSISSVVEGVQQRSADNFLVHPDYREDSKSKDSLYDIAVIKFSGEPFLGAKPVPLLPPQFSHYLKKGAPIRVAGYGVIDRKHTEELNPLHVVDLKIGNPNYSSTQISLTQFKKGICIGDSGGPAWVDIDGQLFLAAVAKSTQIVLGVKCSGNTVFTRVDRYYDWIQLAEEELASAASEINE